MTLDIRKLGSSGLQITTVGLGAWAIGGDWIYGWGHSDDADSIRAIQRAVDEGVSWIDTAAAYGLGHSEEVVGWALKEIPASRRPLVFTKCGVVGDPARPHQITRRYAHPDSVRAECDASLKRLGIERIDLYQIHWPDETGIPVEDSWGAMTRLQDEGKVRLIGVSNFDVSQLASCERIRHVDSLQPPFSMLVRETAAELLPWCAANGTGVIVYSPMASGILTDSFSRGRVEAMEKTDWRTRTPRFLEPELTANLALRDALKPIAERHGTTVSAVAVAWVLSWPGVTGAIVGARKPEQVDGWLPAGNLELSAADLDEIAGAIGRTGAGSGPERPAA
jgi:aryl-alcohol dehydrogenase-like predicted oxidoreductase